MTDFDINHNINVFKETLLKCIDNNEYLVQMTKAMPPVLYAHCTIAAIVPLTDQGIIHFVDTVLDDSDIQHKIATLRNQSGIDFEAALERFLNKSISSMGYHSTGFNDEPPTTTIQ